jgi:hypothetical protein
MRKTQLEQAEDAHKINHGYPNDLAGDAKPFVSDKGKKPSLIKRMANKMIGGMGKIR